MVSSKYLHEYDLLDEFLEDTYQPIKDIYDVNKSLDMYTRIYTEKKFLGETIDGYEYILEDANKGLVSKIGEAVIKFFKAVEEMFVKIINNLSESFKKIRKSSRDETLKKQIENNPENAQKFIDAVMSGNIKLNDVKDMDMLLDTAQRMTDDLMKGKMDKETFTDKINIELEKFSCKAKPLTEAITVACGLYKGIELIDKIKQRNQEYCACAIESRHKAAVNREKMYNDAVQEAHDNKEKSNRLSIALSAQRKVMASLGKNYSTFGKLMDRVLGWMQKQTSKVDKKYADSFYKNGSTFTPRDKASKQYDIFKNTFPSQNATSSQNS